LGPLIKRRARAAITALLVCAIAGCAAELPRDLSDTIEVRIVDGLEPHTPVDEGTLLPVFHGLQGGFHVFLALEVSNLDPGSDTLLEGLGREDLPQVTFTLRAPDGLINVASPQQSLADVIDEGWRIGPELVVLRYYEELPLEGFDTVEREAELERFVIDIEAHVEDVRGATGSATTQAQLVFQPCEPSAGPAE